MKMLDGISARRIQQSVAIQNCCVFDGVKYYTKAHQEMYTRIALMAKDNFGKVYVMDGKESIFGTSLINQKINLLYKKKEMK